MFAVPHRQITEVKQALGPITAHGAVGGRGYFSDMKKPNLFRLGQVIEKYGRDGVIRTLDP
jgi:hypothetical protein